jgi:hypothetical protein
MDFEWKPGFGLYSKYDAQKIGEELSAIPVLKPKAVVDFAETHKTSELYQCFEWNNEKAGQLWREQQASDIIRLIVIKKAVNENGEKKTITIRAFENVKSETSGSVYIHTCVALKDPVYKEHILESIRRGIRELSEKGEHYSSLINDYAAYQEGLDSVLQAIEKPSKNKRSSYAGRQQIRRSKSDNRRHNL